MRVGAYEVVSTIGHGAGGVVLRARAPGGAEVAVKVLQTRDPERLARFQRERDMLATLGEAEGFVPILDAGHDPEHGAFLVMPLVAGGTLRERLRRGPLPLPEAVRVGLELAETLGRAHARGIVHRDLKPENVLFTLDGRALVADLGLAKLAGDTTELQLSKTGELRGSAGYMAPEQTNAKYATAAADVFALGAIIYECVAGRPAFVGETPLQVFERMVAGEVEPLSTAAPAAPVWLCRVVERALAADPRARFRDGAALAHALVERADAPPRAADRRVVGAVAALSLVAGGALAMWFATADAPPPATPPVVTSPAPTRGDAAEAPATTEAGVDPPPAPDGAEWVARAQARLDRGDVDGAIADASRAIDAAPRTAAAWAVRAAAYVTRGDNASAIDDAARAIELDETCLQGWISRAAARTNAGQAAAAIPDAARAIELAPRDAHAWATRAVARLNAGDLPGAVDDATRAIELDPDHGAAWKHRAIARLRAGEAAAGVADARRAVELRPRDANAWTTLGALLSEAGDLAGGAEALSRSLELDPADVQAWTNRSVVHMRMGEHERAVADATRAVELAPRSAGTWHQRGLARARGGDHRGAVADLTRTLELAPRSARALVDRAQSRERLGDAAGAIADYEQALALSPRAGWVPGVRQRLAALRATPR